MNRDFLAVLSGKKNIRVFMFWAAFFSFLLVVFVSWLLVSFSIQFGPFGNFLFLTLSFLFFFFLSTRSIVRSLRTLAEGLMSIARGNLDYRVPLPRQDELGNVARSINYMAEQLQSMMEKERRIEMSKMELITHVSHDLRTPLTSIIGYLNLLRHDDYVDLEEHKRYIENAYNKTQQLKKLIDDLFEYTRLTSGSVNLSLQTVDLSSLLEQMIVEFEPVAQAHALTVKRVWEPKQVMARVDVEKFVRAIDNLLMNALKFSLKPGEITVRLMENGDGITLSVENEGNPITPEQERQLFERFYKADPSRSDKDMPPGAGLGLSITKNIVELHGGRTGLVHRSGHFTFFIELPCLK